LIKAISNLAKALSLPTVAEGVETQAPHGYLKSLGCDYAQGFLFSKAIPFDDLLKFAPEKTQKDY